VYAAGPRALAEIGEARAMEPLLPVLEDRNSDVRKAATEALASLGWRPPERD
jgi:HEAT repeat protein